MDIHDALRWWQALEWWKAGLILLGSIYVYYLVFQFTTGMALWPRTGEEHLFHSLEGAMWPITWAFVITRRLLEVVAWLFDRSAFLAFRLGRRMDGVDNRSLAPDMEARLDRVQTDVERASQSNH